MPPTLTSAATIVLLAALGAGQADGDDDARTPVVVLELFTSQGCSSCPPADRLLSRLGAQARVAGARLVPLAYHVDYWNALGWTDPFAAAAWSDRQRSYARALELDTVYTPQLVVDGRLELVGSDDDAALRAIGVRAASAPAAVVELSPAAERDGELQLDVKARVVGRVDAATLRLVVATVESGFETAVASGENRRRTLANDHVVRRLETPFEISAARGVDATRRIEVEIDPGWNRARLAVVAFLQDPLTLAIWGADAVDLGSAAAP